MQTRERSRALMEALGLVPDDHATVKQQFAIEAALEEAAGIPQPDGRELDLIEGLETITRRLEREGESVEARGQCVIALRQTTEQMRNGLGAAPSREMRQMAGEDTEGERRCRSTATPIVVPDGYPEAGTTLPREASDEEEKHEHSWSATYVLGDAGKTVLGFHSLRRCVDLSCDAIQLVYRTPGPSGYRERETVVVPEAEANLIRAVQEEFAKQRIDLLEQRAIRAETTVEQLEGEVQEARGQTTLAQRDYNHLYRDHIAMSEQVDRLVAHLDGSDGFPAAWWLDAADAVRRLDRMVHPREAAEPRDTSDEEQR
jgi:hypothetical protein